MHRRTVLRYTFGLSVATLAGCTGGGDTTDSPDTATPTASATQSPTRTPSPTSTPTADITIDVGPVDLGLRFDPETFTVDVGDTVEWIFRTNGHNVKAESVPDGADWTGTPGEQFDTMAQDTVYRHTFTVAGEYAYFCAPHRSAGMVGSFTVEG